MPGVGRDLLDGDALFGAVVAEEAELDRGGVLAEEREVRPLPVPGRAEREGPPGPRLAAHRVTSAPASAGRTTVSSWTWASWVATRTLRAPGTGTRGPRPEVRDERRLRRAATTSQRPSRPSANRISPRVAVLELAAHLEQPAVELAQRGVAVAGRASSAGTSPGPAGRAPPRPRTRRRRRTPGGARRGWPSAISSSMWSVKNWNGAASPCSSPMKSIGVKGDRSVTRAASGRARGRQAVARGAVADLVVVLVEDHELRGGAVGRRARRSAAGGSSSTGRRARRGAGRPWPGRATAPNSSY